MNQMWNYLLTDGVNYFENENKSGCTENDQFDVLSVTEKISGFVLLPERQKKRCRLQI